MISGLLFTGSSFFDLAIASQSAIGVISSNTTWTNAEGPYELTGPVAVGSGATLTFEAGTTINLNSYYIQVNGTLIARGTSTNLINFNGGAITFTSTSTSWNEQTALGSIIENTQFYPTTDEYGNTRSTNIITIEGVSPKITSNFNVTVIVKGGSPIISHNKFISIQINAGSPQILNNEIDGVQVYGGSPLISSNKIRSGITSSRYPDIRDISVIIWNNDISYPGGQDSAVINLALNGKAIISNNKITGLETPQTRDLLGRTNGPYYTLYGIRIAAGDALISNNIITGCTEASIQVLSWSGTNVIIQSNTINSKGIIIADQVYAKINYNNIEGGIFLSPLAAKDIDATNNWWGTTDQTAISNLIHDNKNDFNLGTVSFKPFLTQSNAQAVPDPNAPMPTLNPSSSPLPTPAPTTSPSETTPSQNPTATPPQSGTETSQSFNWIEIGIFALLAVITVLLTAILVNMRRKQGSK